MLMRNEIDHCGFKQDIVKPLVKKNHICRNEIKNYRSIYNKNKRWEIPRYVTMDLHIQQEALRGEVRCLNLVTEWRLIV